MIDPHEAYAMYGDDLNTDLAAAAEAGEAGADQTQPDIAAQVDVIAIDLAGIREKHRLWLAGERGGKRANLRGANLNWANLRGANLSRANIDFAAWPLWCGSRNVRVDVRLARQLAAHFCALACDDAEYEATRQAVLPFARLSHIASDLHILR